MDTFKDSQGTMKLKSFRDINLKIKFKDIAGLYVAKKEIKEFVDFLKNP